MTLYALNLFDLADNDLYRQCSRRSVAAVEERGGKVVALGRLAGVVQTEPGVAPRTVMVLVEWPSRGAFDAFREDSEHEDLHPLRKDGTRNYLWWTYERLEDLHPLFGRVPQAGVDPVITVAAQVICHGRSNPLAAHSYEHGGACRKG
jgi:uncharacterized protein (DUF1330 family)